MPTVGQQLRAAREAQKLTIYQVAEMTRIRSDHIRAIDQGEYDVFSAPVYIRGFVRTYAMILKLDPDPILELLNKELVATGRSDPNLSSASPDRTDSIMFQLSKVNWALALRAFVVIAVIAGGCVGYSLWHKAQTHDPLEGLSAGLYEASPSSLDTLPLPSHR